MANILCRPHSTRHHVIAALGGLVFAIVMSQALRLQGRHAIAFVAGVILLSLAMCLAASMRDLLLYLLAFNLPFTSIEKAFLLVPYPSFMTAGIAIGLADILLITLYAFWFSKIFITREERFPTLTMLDWWVLAFIAAHGISLLHSASRILTLYEIIRLGKYALVYFYIAHNLRRQHLKWMVAGLLFTIVVQSPLGIVQHRTGSLMGIGHTKGATELEYEQYTVTGFEAVRRAEGTTFDSHALGLFFAMTLPLPLGLALTPKLRIAYRFAGAGVFIIGLAGLAVSFARAGWAAFLGACLVLMWCFVRWKEWRRIALAGMVVTGLGVPALLPFAPEIRQRLFEAPPELVTGRLETIHMSIDIWRDSPWTGCGANGYMRALENRFSVFEGDSYFIPPHNMMVFVMTELGAIGLFIFVGLSVAICMTNWKVIRCGDSRLRILAGALLAGFVALQLEGISDPIYITSVTYFLLWFQIGISAALYRLCQEAPA